MFSIGPEQLTQDDVDLGQLVYEQFIAENPSVVRKFNRKLGL